MLTGVSGPGCDVTTEAPTLSPLLEGIANIIGDLGNLTPDQLQQLLAAILQAILNTAQDNNIGVQRQRMAGEILKYIYIRKYTNIIGAAITLGL